MQMWKQIAHMSRAIGGSLLTQGNLFAVVEAYELPESKTLM